MQIAIVLYKGMTALDAIGPYEVFRFIPDVEIRFVSNKPQPIITDSGILVLGATHSFEETNNPDIILVPGSSSDTTTAMADKNLINWIKETHKTTQYTLSVCSGSLVLAAAGILKGHSATSHWIGQKALEKFGAVPQRNERIVKSGKIITSAGVSAGIDLALTLVKEMCGKERAETIQLLIEYDPMPPVDSGHPSKASTSVYKQAKEIMLKEAKNRKNFISIPKIFWNVTLKNIKQKLEKKV